MEESKIIIDFFKGIIGSLVCFNTVILVQIFNYSLLGYGGDPFINSGFIAALAWLGVFLFPLIYIGIPSIRKFLNYEY